MPHIPNRELRRTLANNLRAFRRQKQISQEKLAEICKLHRTYIGAIEREERNVTLGTLESLSNALGTSVPELLTNKESGSSD